ncbi:hypothetical protein HBH56_235000 [Parastagonospora nodorum]|uniref:Uncharacterized protein n=1 Tax=Phaeosphaeria nodorum (strain SN15 / ATCC MYA-4574 / FGSC 10173) TaxID=321614 RepID=A0A7U2I2K8_PHANO|nr:hypothetical protein HBH56_235000 [Parastagonospora nodorum]QRC99494.1 hypothetical protein JI435_144040 [Parastagonospora nodorum SN15]KAH3924447.1 hypothetical protein HBH54_193380 [Parastagonospora nodorum]KAH3959482.1 hypothetical protein HBH52_243390 [Parastagonospora nodorum]KAH4097348.1 hypothetical protein HBH46_163310 [Parastagonospora nodorum]
MAPSEPKGKYRPTSKLSEKDRNAKYTHKQIERIMRQLGRPWMTRPRALNKVQLIALWIAQDQQIKDAKGKQSKDYVSVPGQDGLPNKVLGETTDGESSDDDDDEEDFRKPVKRNSNSEDDAVDDYGKVTAEENVQPEVSDASDPDDHIELPTVPSMRKDLQKWGIKIGSHRNSGPMFKLKWKPEFLRRRAAERSKEAGSSDPVENDDDALSDRCGDTEEVKREKSRAPTEEKTKPRKRKRNASGDDRTGKRVKPNETKAKSSTVEPGKLQHYIGFQMSGTRELVAGKPHDQLPVAGAKMAASEPAVASMLPFKLGRNPAKKVTMADRQKLSEEVSGAERGATTSAELGSHDLEQLQNGPKTIAKSGESYSIMQNEGLRQSKRLERTAADIQLDGPQAKAAPESAKPTVTGSALYIDQDASSEDDEDGIGLSSSINGDDVDDDDADDLGNDGTSLTRILVTGPQRGPGGANAHGTKERPYEFIPGGYCDPVVAAAWPVRNQTVNFMHRPPLWEARIIDPSGFNYGQYQMWLEQIREGGWWEEMMKRRPDQMPLPPRTRPVYKYRYGGPSK